MSRGLLPEKLLVAQLQPQPQTQLSCSRQRHSVPDLSHKHSPILRTCHTHTHTLHVSNHTYFCGCLRTAQKRSKLEVPTLRPVVGLRTIKKTEDNPFRPPATTYYIYLQTEYCVDHHSLFFYTRRLIIIIMFFLFLFYFSSWRYNSS
jgi:hypothetical protein